MLGYNFTRFKNQCHLCQRHHEMLWLGSVWLAVLTSFQGWLCFLWLLCHFVHTSVWLCLYQWFSTEHITQFWHATKCSSFSMSLWLVCCWRISKAIQDILHFDLMQQEDKSWPQGSDRQLVITAYEYQSPLWRGWSLTTSSMPPGCWKVHCVFELVIFRILDKSASVCDPLPVCVQLFTHL